jgi:hypothetical protein
MREKDKERAGERAQEAGLSVEHGMEAAEWHAWEASARMEDEWRQCVGMDSDVWKSELSVFVSAKNVNMDIRIRIRF